MRRFVFCTILVWAGLLLLPAVSRAQGTSTGSIAGAAKDSSGAVLPGVTVEASSPALIEKVRTTTTDDKGEYKITELRPGTYAVTFTLPGFNTFKRDGLQLAPNFTATINATLAVGAIQETVTVSGSTPLVDTQNVSQQRTISKELLDAVPSAKSMLALASLMPSVVEPPNAQDVGGSKGERSVRLSVHGSKTYDSRLLQDGMRYTALTPFPGTPVAPQTIFVPTGEGTGRGYYINPLAAQEVVIDTGSLGSAQYQYGGAQVNMIPKDGGNSFSGVAVLRRHRQRTPEQQSHRRSAERGPDVGELGSDRSTTSTPPSAARSSRIGSGSSGRRAAGARRRRVANLYGDANLSARVPGAPAAVWRYAPDLNNPIYPAEIDHGFGVRFTIKPSVKDKFTVLDRQAAELPGSADRAARDRHDQERGQRGILPGPAGRPGHLDPPAVDQAPARRRPDREPIHLRRIRQRHLPERLPGVRRRSGQQRADQRRQPRLHLQRHRQPEHGVVESAQQPIQRVLSDRRPQHQDRRVPDVRTDRRTEQLHRPGRRGRSAACRCRIPSATARRFR